MQVVLHRGDEDVAPAQVRPGQRPVKQALQRVSVGDIRPAQALQHGVQVGLAQPVAHLAGAVRRAQGAQVADEGIGDALVLQLLADVPAEGKAGLQHSLSVAAEGEAVAVQHHGHGPLHGEILLAHGQAAQPGGLGPGDLLHGLAARVVPIAQGEHRVLHDEAVHRAVAHPAAHHLPEAPGIDGAGQNHQLPVQIRAPGGRTQAHEVAALQRRPQKQIAPARIDGEGRAPGQPLPGHHVDGAAQGAAAALHVLRTELSGHVQRVRHVLVQPDEGQKAALAVGDHRHQLQRLPRLRHGLGGGAVVFHALQVPPEGVELRPGDHRRQHQQKRDHTAPSTGTGMRSIRWFSFASASARFRPAPAATRWASTQGAMRWMSSGRA